MTAYTATYSPDDDKVVEMISTSIAIRKAERPQLKRRGKKAFSVAALRGHSIYPAPVAVAEFAAGEKIRMSFWQRAGKQWDFSAARRLVAQAIGNERGRGGVAYSALTADLDRKIAAAIAISKDSGISLEEADAARAGAERLEKKRAAAIKRAQTEALDAFSAKYGTVFPRATDFVSFYIEHDGERIDPPAVVSLPHQAKRIIEMSKNYDVTIKWHTPTDATVRETVVKTWASSPKLAEKIGLRGARLDGTVPKDAIIDPAFPGTLQDKIIVVSVADPPTVAAVINIKTGNPIDPIESEPAPTGAAAPSAAKIEHSAPVLVKLEADDGPPPMPLSEIFSELESHLGDDFLETKAWRRVRSRVAALTRQAAA